MKKLILLIVALFVFCMSVSAVQDTQMDKIIDIVRLLEIMNGDENGNLNLDNNVTRAEFVKMAICASSHKSSVTTAPQSTLFPDVRNSHWATKYIGLAISNGWINGYLDGTFRPDNNVKLEEAVNIVLKILGYTESDLAGAFPSPQMSNYISLKLDTGIQREQGSFMTRRDCMLLIYNMLNTKNKNGTVHAQSLGYNVDSNNRIDYLAVVDKNTDGPFVVNDSSWMTEIGINPQKAVVWQDGEIISSQSVKKHDVLYYSKPLDTVWCYDNKKSGIVNGVSPSKSSPSSVNLSGINYNIASDSVAFSLSELGDVKQGDIVTLLLGRNDVAVGLITADASDSSMYTQGDLDYDKIVSSTINGPYIVNGTSYKEKIGFDLSTAYIYRNDTASDASKISEWDVYYYSKTLKTVWVYSKKVSGKYESAMPDKSAPTSVVVSGKNYTVETSAVAYKLSSAGEFNIGDNVTLLLGKSGAIAGVIGADEFSNEIIGIVTDFYTKEYTTTYGGTYTSNCVVVNDLNGNTLEYPTKLSYLTKGKMVSVKSTSSGSTITNISKNYTDVKDLNTAMKSGKYAENAQIADLCGSTLTPVYPPRLEGCTVSANDVVYYKLNSDGEITVLVLNDYTGDNHTYVILQNVSESVTSRGSKGSYEYFGANGQATYSSDMVYGLEIGAASIEYDGNKVSKIQNLFTAATLDRVGTLTALSSEVTYDVWDKVLVLEYKGSDYRVISISDIENNDNYSLVGWLDKSPNRGGLIRIIIATPQKIK